MVEADSDGSTWRLYAEDETLLEAYLTKLLQFELMPGLRHLIKRLPRKFKQRKTRLRALREALQRVSEPSQVKAKIDECKQLDKGEKDGGVLPQLTDQYLEMHQNSSLKEHLRVRASQQNAQIHLIKERAYRDLEPIQRMVTKLQTVITQLTSPVRQHALNLPKVNYFTNPCEKSTLYKCDAMLRRADEVQDQIFDFENKWSIQVGQALYTFAIDLGVTRYYPLENLAALTKTEYGAIDMTLACFSIANFCDADIYLTGGFSEEQAASPSTYVFSLEQHVWSESHEMCQARSSHSSCSFEHKIYVFGGRDAHGRDLDSIEALDVEANQPWHIFRVPPFTPRKFAAVSPLNNEQIVIFGGITVEGEKLSDVIVLDVEKRKAYLVQQNEPRVEFATSGQTVMVSPGLVVSYGSNECVLYRNQKNALRKLIKAEDLLP